MKFRAPWIYFRNGEAVRVFSGLSLIIAYITLANACEKLLADYIAADLRGN
jgi:hypothetical protein